MTEGCKRKMGKAHPRSKAMKVVIPLPMKTSSPLQAKIRQHARIIDS